jgi:hypothetical protein
MSSLFHCGLFILKKKQEKVKWAKKVEAKCLQCNVPLCVHGECWGVYHRQKKYAAQLVSQLIIRGALLLSMRLCFGCCPPREAPKALFGSDGAPTD